MTEVGSVKNVQEVANGPVSVAIQRFFGGIPAEITRGPAPVHLWNPPYCGEIDMRISSDGAWHYNGSAIRRPALVKLFASILRKDSSGFVLVTPVERVGIQVDDAPFLAVDMAIEPGKQAEKLVFRTNLDDVVVCGHDHPMRFEIGAGGALKPYLHVRGDLWALVTRALTHDLVARAGVEQVFLHMETSPVRDPLAVASIQNSVWGSDSPRTSGRPPQMGPAGSGETGVPMFGLRSDEAFFAIVPAAEIEALT